MAYSAEEFRLTQELLAGSDEPLGTLAWRRVDAALRIAERVMRPGIIEQAALLGELNEGDGDSYTKRADLRAAAIRKALTEDGHG